MHLGTAQVRIVYQKLIPESHNGPVMRHSAPTSRLSKAIQKFLACSRKLTLLSCLAPLDPRPKPYHPTRPTLHRRSAFA